MLRFTLTHNLFLALFKWKNEERVETSLSHLQYHTVGSVKHAHFAPCSCNSCDALRHVSQSERAETQHITQGIYNQIRIRYIRLGKLFSGAFFFFFERLQDHDRNFCNRGVDYEQCFRSGLKGFHFSIALNRKNSFWAQLDFFSSCSTLSGH